MHLRKSKTNIIHFKETDLQIILVIVESLIKENSGTKKNDEK